MGIFYTWAKTTQNSYSGFLWWLYRIIYDINVFWTNWLSLGRNSLKLRDKVVPLMFVTSKAFSPAIELNEPTIPLLVIRNARISIASGQLSQENHKVQGLCPRERERKWIKQLSCRLVPFFTPHFSHSLLTGCSNSLSQSVDFVKKTTDSLLYTPDMKKSCELKTINHERIKT